MAQHFELLKRVIVTKKQTEEGLFCLCVYKNGTWKTVIVDDLLPHNKYGTLVFSMGKEQQYWVPLLEKALAKHLGGYAALEEGKVSEILKLLTGYPVETVELEQHTLDTMESGLLYEKLSAHLNDGLLICADTTRCDVSESAFNAVNLEPGLTYAIVDHRVTKSRERFLCLHNLKAYGDGRLMSSKPQAASNENLFWMNISSFSQYFAKIYICYVRDDWYNYHMEGAFTRRKDTFHRQFHLKIREDTNLDLHVERTTMTDEIIEAVIVISDDKGNIVDSTTCKESSNVLWSGGLCAGSYDVTAVSFSKWKSSETIKFSLMCQSDRPLTASVNACRLSTYTDTIIRLVLAKGGQIEQSETVDNSIQMYCLEEPYWYGIIMLVVNNDPCKEFYIRCQAAANNVISTRTNPTATTTIDRIPANSRQITQIYTCADGRDKNGYSIDFQTGVFEYKYALTSRHCSIELTLKTSEMHHPMSNDLF